MNSALWHLFMARVRSFYREPSVLFWAFGFPMLLAVALGIAFRNQPPDPVDVGVSSACGPDVRAALEADPDVRMHALSDADAGRALRTGAVALIVDCDGARAYRFDPTRPESRLARLVAHDALERGAGRIDRTRPDERRVTEAGARYIDFLIPGLIGSNIMSAGLWGLGFTLVDMRVRKLLKRLAATPMRRTDFLLSFLLVRALLALIELPAMLLFAWLAFGVTVHGSIPLLIGVAVLGSLVFGGVGVLVAARAQNTQTISGLINLVSMPMYLCSGVFFSAAKFPAVMQPVVRALPLTALIDALRGVMTDGEGLTAIAPRLAVFLAWGVVAFAVAVKGFRWR